MLPLSSLQIKLFAGIGLALVVIGLVTYHIITVASLESEVAHQKGMVAEANSRISTLESANYKMSVDFKAQNEAIDRVVTASVETSKAAQAALELFRTETISIRKGINHLLSQKSSGDLLTDCGLLNTNLNNELAGRHK